MQLLHGSRTIFVTLLLGLLASCTSSPRVFTDFDPEQSFSEYQTFTWLSDQPMNVSGDRAPSPLTAKRLQESIKQNLIAKGFKFVENREEADFAVGFTVGTREKMEIREREVDDFYGSHWRWGYDYFGRVSRLDTSRTEVTTREYSEGSLAIDIFDVSTKSPVWHSQGSKRLSKAELSGDSAESTDAAIQAMLAGFPPGSEPE